VIDKRLARNEERRRAARARGGAAGTGALPLRRSSPTADAQARFIVERLRRALPILSGSLQSRSVEAREAIASLERFIAAYDRIAAETAR
jgi:hypothetical protein